MVAVVGAEVGGFGLVVGGAGFGRVTDGFGFDFGAVLVVGADVGGFEVLVVVVDLVLGLVLGAVVEGGAVELAVVPRALGGRVAGVGPRDGPVNGPVTVESSGFSLIPTSRSPGSGNVPGSVFAVTACMNLRHISAGSVPPWTVMPCTLSIDRLSPSGYPIHTAAVSFGV